MICSTIQSKMGELLDEQLSAVERLEINNHLQGCNDCKAHFEQLKSIKQQVNQLAMPALSDTFDQGLAAKIAAFEQQKSPTASNVVSFGDKQSNTANNAAQTTTSQHKVNRFKPMLAAAAIVTSIAGLTLVMQPTSESLTAKAPISSIEPLTPTESLQEIEIIGQMANAGFEPLPMTQANESGEQVI